MISCLYHSSAHFPSHHLHLRSPTHQPTTNTNNSTEDASLTPPPKAPATSYALFVKDQYAARKQDYLGSNGKVDFTAATNAISSDWANLSSTEKEKFSTQAKELKKAYDAEYKSWYDSLDKDTLKAIQVETGKKVSPPGGKRGKRAEEDARPGNPGRPLTAFFEFLNTVKEGEGKDLGVVERAKLAGEKWKAMAEQEKEVSAGFWRIQAG